MTDTQRVILGTTIAAIVGFVIGASWQYSSARAYSNDLDATRMELDSTRHELLFQELEAMLGAATIEAQRGNHESARRLASDFFTDLQQNIGSAPQAAQPQLRSILDQRDVMITELSRANMETGGLLAEVFAEYREAMDRPVGPMPPPSADPQPMTTGM
ncbi:MAG: hypothetical protein KFH98_16650 [Gemmatimonadetes bacterium]|nr:hypothetical protein [Gemmatimonadota bacterium]